MVAKLLVFTDQSETHQNLERLLLINVKWCLECAEKLSRQVSYFRMTIRFQWQDNSLMEEKLQIVSDAD